MPGYLVPAQQSTNPFTPTSTISSITVGDALIEIDKESIHVFNNESARSAAIPSPTEGMVTYLKNVKAVNVYNGIIWVAIGGGSDISPLGVVGT
jgi:hypothetical protein